MTVAVQFDIAANRADALAELRSLPDLQLLHRLRTRDPLAWGEFAHRFRPALEGGQIDRAERARGNVRLPFTEQHVEEDPIGLGRRDESLRLLQSTRQLL